MGMLPPSDSEDESSEGDEAPRGQNPNMGMLPPSDSEDDSDASGSEKDASEVKKEKPLRPAVAEVPKKKEEEEIDPEQARIDLERLELVRKRREEQRLKRIADEGFDRFAPVTETNRPPAPPGYPGDA